MVVFFIPYLSARLVPSYHTYNAINKPNIWVAIDGLNKNKGDAFITFLKTLLFGRYDGPSLKLKGEFVFYNEQGEENEKNEVEFNFGKDPVKNVQEIFKGMKKLSGVDDLMSRIDALFEAYFGQVNGKIENNNIINTNLNNS